MERAQDAQATSLVTAPPIGVYWPGQAGIYMGEAVEDADYPQGHLVLCEIAAPKEMKWAAAVKWAKEQTVDGHTDLRLPTRFEAALIYANGQKHVDQTRWHWTGTPYNDSYAWYCDFSSGNQYNDLKSYEGCARAVRRFVL